MNCQGVSISCLFAVEGEGDHEYCENALGCFVVALAFSAGPCEGKDVYKTERGRILSLAASK